MKCKMKQLTWVTNFCKSDINNMSLHSVEDLKEYHRLKSLFIQGEPKATNTYTVAELKAMGIVGFCEGEDCVTSS